LCMFCSKILTGVIKSSRVNRSSVIVAASKKNARRKKLPKTSAIREAPSTIPVTPKTNSKPLYKEQGIQIQNEE
ncbi:hypothetical protein PENTCL1PPCAC_10242, partial [Pristionchus entomophagus]